MPAGLLESLGPWMVALAGVAAASVLLLLGVLVSRRARRVALEGAVSSFLHGSVVDRRKWARRKGNRVPVLLSDARARAQPTEAWVLDRSEGGICLLVEETVAAGVVLSVRPAGAAETVPWLRVEARGCRPIVGGFALGCRFVDPPPLHVLLLFG